MIQYSDFTVRRQNVLNALLWLEQNNPFYKSIIIDTAMIQLPVNNVPPELLHNSNNSLDMSTATIRNQFNSRR